MCSEAPSIRFLELLGFRPDWVLGCSDREQIIVGNKCLVLYFSQEYAFWKFIVSSRFLQSFQEFGHRRGRGKVRTGSLGPEASGQPGEVPEQLSSPLGFCFPNVSALRGPINFDFCICSPRCAVVEIWLRLPGYLKPSPQRMWRLPSQRAPNEIQRRPRIA